MQIDKFSLKRMVSWIRCVDDEKQGYFPPPATTDNERLTDRFIRARFGLLTHAIMLVKHDSLMKPHGVLERAGRMADLPEELCEVYGMYLRSVFFTKDGGFAPQWWSVLTTLNPPSSGWPNLVFEAGMLNILKGVKPHEDSRLGGYFEALHGNMKEYKAYRAEQKKLVNSGRSVRVLSAEDYFKGKGWNEDCEGRGSQRLKELLGRKSTHSDALAR